MTQPTLIRRPRHRPPLPGHTTHKNCANCLPYALKWRDRVLNGLPSHHGEEGSAAA
ncbi:hypothetical protein ACIOHE_29545 [Streptomyces sp. NPDC087851]|uniref:hypothetical protein n=1 Tax=Streptomyces sp. NPDC087851 TaxID=3365810 RepID=UPI00381FA110